MKEKILSISTSAIEHIANLLLEKSSGSIFHLSVKKTGCNGYMYVPGLLDAPTENDICIEDIAPFPVYIAAASVELVRGTVIDFEVKSFGMQQLTFDNPNAEGLCGCGESFNIKEEKK